MAYISVALRQAVYDRANGCCEYSLVPESFALASHENVGLLKSMHWNISMTHLLNSF